jgi:hypothetical protein
LKKVFFNLKRKVNKIPILKLGYQDC